MRLGWIKELHDKKKFMAVKVSADENLADDESDDLTKPLDAQTKKKLDLEQESIKQQILSSFRGHLSSDRTGSV